jgi:site-specific recombinase XerC
MKRTAQPKPRQTAAPPARPSSRALVRVSQPPDDGLNRIVALVLDAVHSENTKTAYRIALSDFLSWYRQTGASGFHEASVNAWRSSVEARAASGKRMSASTINVRLAAVRKLAMEAADNGLLAPEAAAAIGRIKGIKRQGVRTGNWLDLKQA